MAGDRRRVQALAAGADVLLTNLSDGVLVSAGLDAATLAPVAPGLIYCGISAYGHTGPLAGRKAFDSVMQAHAGRDVADRVARPAHRSKPPSRGRM